MAVKALALAMAVMVLAGTAAGARSGEEADDRERADAEDRARMLQVEVRPTSLQMSSYIHFDEDGEVRNESHNFSLTMSVSYSPTITLTGYSGVEFTRIVTDTGEELEPPEPRSMNGNIPHNQRGHPRFSISTQFPMPPARAKALAEVSGRMTLHLAAGQTKQATLSPIQELEGKRVRIEGLSREVVVTVRREEENKRVRVEYPSSAAPLISEVELTDAAGNAIATRGAGRGSNGNTAYLLIHAALPDGGRVILSFHQKVEEVEVSFTMHDVPLPRPEPRGEEVVLRAVPPGEVEAPAADPGEPDVEGLKVIVE